MAMGGGQALSMTETPWSAVPDAALQALDIVARRLERSVRSEAKIVSIWTHNGRTLARIRCGVVTFRLTFDHGEWRFV